MKLTIDTHDREKIIIKLNEKEFVSTKKQASDILSLIKASLIKEKKELKDISEVFVHTGPGSYTGIRVGATIAQTLAWSLNVPLNGQSTLQKLDIFY